MIKSTPVLRSIAPLLMDSQRRANFKSLPTNIQYHNLMKPLPYESASVDVVYHSHVLEHFDRDVAESFLLEAKRTLKPGGIQRVVVPDLEEACRSYLDHVDRCSSNSGDAAGHDQFVAAILEQAVRREAIGTARQGPLRRWIENHFIGDARKRGETHQWMYDRVNLTEKLLRLGFREVHVQKFNESLIPSWNELHLDQDPSGNEYKPESLYVEAVK